MSDNPLLHLAHPLPFGDVLPEHVEPAMTALIADAQERLHAIIAAPAPRTWANSAGALDAATERLDNAWTLIHHLRSVAHTDELEAAVVAATPAVTAFYASIALNEPLYQALDAYSATDEAQALTGARRRYLHRTLDDFRRRGVQLAAEPKQRLEAIAGDLAQLANRFSSQVLGASAAWSLEIHDAARLAGLPPSAMGMLEAVARAAGQETGWRITLAAPVATAVLTHAEDRALRQQVWRAYHQRAAAEPFNNAPIIPQMLALRSEQAAILGFPDFVDLVLADRMARTGAAANTFVADLESRARAAFEDERAALATFAASEGGPAVLEPWDVAFWAERQRKARFDLDEEELRPYFPFDGVLQGMFELTGDLFGFSVAPSDAPTWHPDVRAFDLRDVDGAVLGTFFADFFPRPTKRDGAWMNGLLTGLPQADGGRSRHVGIICGNFTPPQADQPALLTHREVETLFHEFGHLLHHLLSTAELRSQAGTNVAWDFVELPSQILENWCWERAALDRFARHVETGATIPDDLFERMTAARTYRGATFLMRQVGFCRVDLDLHSAWKADDGDPVRLARDILAAYAPTDLPDDYAMITSFGHLFADAVGYAAGYYSYQWAAVLDADAFARFQEEGIFSPAVGRAFRDRVLSRGDSDDPAELFRSFRGREPRVDAHLRRHGLAA